MVHPANVDKSWITPGWSARRWRMSTRPIRASAIQGRLMAATRWIIATLWLAILVVIYQRIGHLEALGALLATLVLIALYGGHGRTGSDG